MALIELGKEWFRAEGRAEQVAKDKAATDELRQKRDEIVDRPDDPDAHAVIDRLREKPR